jgi:hypothetical protein
MLGSMLRPAGERLWIADGPPVRFLGVPYPTRMVVVRLADGGLWIWSPLAPEGGLAEAVERLGPVHHLVEPNKLHHLFLDAWRARHPRARLHGPPGLVRKRRDLPFEPALRDDAPEAWRGQIDEVVFRGSLFMDEVVFFHRASRTALVGDLIQRFDPAGLHGWRAALMRLDGLVGPDGSTPREWRASWWRRAPARAALRTALAWRPARLVIAHGELPDEPGAEALARGLRWLGVEPGASGSG